jgi:hypothetical protein
MDRVCAPTSITMSSSARASTPPILLWAMVCLALLGSLALGWFGSLGIGVCLLAVASLGAGYCWRAARREAARQAEIESADTVLVDRSLPQR